MAYTERYVRADAAGGGNGTTDAASGANGSYTFAEMLADATAGSIRYNIKAGTYSRTTAADVFTTAGAATAPRSMRGFNSTLGDLWANGRTAGGALVKTNFPAITYTTGNLTIPANFVVESLSVTSAKAGNTVTTGTAAGIVFQRCYLENTHANSGAAIALYIADTYTSAVDCDTYCSTASASAKALSVSRGTAYGGLHICTSGIAVETGAFAAVCGLLVRDSATGISISGSLLMPVIGCSFRNISGTYISNGSTNPGMAIVNCVAWGSAGSSKWYNSTTSVRQHAQHSCAIGNMGAADSNEGDWPVVGEITLTGDPFTSSTDLRLNNTSGAGAACRGAGLNAFDLGAWQSAAAVGGGVPSFGAFAKLGPSFAGAM